MARGGEPLYRALMHDVTFYLCYVLLTATLGPFHFGYHLVGIHQITIFLS